MKKTKRTRSKSGGIQVGDISDISGNVNVAGGDITTHQTNTGLSGVEIKQLFDQLYSAIDSRPQTSAADKEDLKSEVQEIQSAVTAAVQKKEDVDEGFLLRRFRNIARMAPDMVDVATATLANPLAGLGIMVNKIALKAKEQAGNA